MPETGGINMTQLYGPLLLAAGALLLVGGFALRRQVVRN
jgi:hypothetical protein